MTAPPPGAGLTVALRRVVLGYRIVGVVWLWLLAAVVLVTENVDAMPLLATGAVAAAWTALTLYIGIRRPRVLESPVWIAIDTVVSGLVILLSTTVHADRGFTGGYPFSTVLLAAYAVRLRGSLPVALVMSGVSLLLLGVGEAIGSALIYLAGAGVGSWAMDVLERNERERLELQDRLADERAERLRSQERAETAAALHDSVLQTLALIQRRRDDPGEVGSLARRQERDLRDWLSGRRGRLGAGEAAGSLAEAIKDVAADIEADHELTVEVVTVGDAPVDDDVDALVAAVAEALRNVAKHAGVATASVYAETDARQAAVFVRDRGAGFDPAAVPDDRRGIAESITGRMQRHGGTAAVRATPGEGTEVELRLPLAGPD